LGFIRKRGRWKKKKVPDGRSLLGAGKPNGGRGGGGEKQDYISLYLLDQKIKEKKSFFPFDHKLKQKGESERGVVRGPAFFPLCKWGEEGTRGKTVHHHLLRPAKLEEGKNWPFPPFSFPPPLSFTNLAIRGGKKLTRGGEGGGKGAGVEMLFFVLNPYNLAPGKNVMQKEKSNGKKGKRGGLTSSPFLIEEKKKKN